MHEIIDPVMEPHLYVCSKCFTNTSANGCARLQEAKNELMAFKESRQIPEVPKQDNISFDATNVAAITKQISMNSTLLSEVYIIRYCGRVWFY